MRMFLLLFPVNLFPSYLLHWDFLLPGADETDQGIGVGEAVWPCPLGSRAGAAAVLWWVCAGLNLQDFYTTEPFYFKYHLIYKKISELWKEHKSHVLAVFSCTFLYLWLSSAFQL